MPLSYVHADLILRSAAIGIILILSIVLATRRPVPMENRYLIGLCPCIVAYLALTSPITFTGMTRGVLLALSHLIPFVVWVLSFRAFDHLPREASWPVWTKLALGAALVWHFFFFVVRQGVGRFHDVSHALYLVLFLSIIVAAILGWNDDLVEPRRRLRALVLVLLSLYLTVVVIVELTGLAWGDQQLVRAVNAAVILLAVAAICLQSVEPTNNPWLEEVQGEGEGPESDEPTIDPSDGALYRRLIESMEAGRYRETGLSISRLASQLGTSEHRLRRLINRSMGYRNFSGFLNHYRILEAKQRLDDAMQRQTPILTIALDVGFGSIGPFNRAFKAIVGTTPTAFRNNRGCC